MQELIYDSDASSNPHSRRLITVDGDPVIVRAAGLETPVPIYVAVGECAGCAPADIKWVPLTRCGAPVELSANNVEVVLESHGKYAFGDPLDESFTLTGDVNVTTEAVPRDELPSTDCSGGTATVETSCENPLHVQICGSMPVEFDLTPLGCVTDAEGNAIGKVMVRIDRDETTGAENTYMVAFMEDGTIQNPYTGAWSVCEPSPCPDDTPLGRITDFSALGA